MRYGYTFTQSGKTVLFALTLAVAVGCSEDSTPTDDGGNVDTTPPAVSTVTPIDASHIDVAFNENVSRSSAEDDGHYIIIEQTTAYSAQMKSPAAPGDTLHVAAASLKSDNRTVSITIEGVMFAAPYELTVIGVKDMNGNEIDTPVVTSFTGTTASDVTPPEIVYRSPAPNATGVGVGSPVVIQLSESVDYGNFVSAASWTSLGGPVTFNVQSDDAYFSLVSTSLLSLNTVYTVTLTGVEDPSGNIMPTASWSFTTTNIPDTTPPTVVSSSPADGQVAVDVNSSLSLTFSEAVNQALLDPGLLPIRAARSRGPATARR
jgi:hypothetical protein